MQDITVAHIDLEALKHNFALIKEKVPACDILPMLKANAYGHGMLSIAKVFPKEQYLGVAHVMEVIYLRNNDIQNPLVVMRGFFNEDELSYFLRDNHAIAVIHDHSQLELLKNCVDSSIKIKVWLKINTGMNRLGFSVDEASDVYNTLKQIALIHQVECVFTHLCDADNTNVDYTQKQIQQFSTLTMPVKKSILNSAGILNYSNYKMDWVRPGIILYGASPFHFHSPHYALLKKFKAVMTLTSRIIALKTVYANEVIGYGCTYRAEKNMNVAVIGIGYGDGYPRHASGAPVLIQGKRCKIVGRIAMDMMVVDVSHLQNVKVGDSVILWGQRLSVDEIAHYASTISYELLSKITGRVKYQTEMGVV